MNNKGLYSKNRTLREISVARSPAIGLAIGENIFLSYRFLVPCHQPNPKMSGILGKTRARDGRGECLSLWGDEKLGEHQEVFWEDFPPN
ncbi:hypothetical protein J0895_04110 [Phormidium pseudopriestleyi FRX01]|uniref:Uncharacterized protein n=1 Tax=Phormidium pseudopriestleyi FRX01 TaxID=1759528 RepID=A0ABS3FMH3_9CYAN|nr:hypothetical protein [Phormidium pseudopriestleyi]MBO0348300.1 hypothetical protein [Phormidium pseudopriestleyi FRX01]